MTECMLRGCGQLICTQQLSSLGQQQFNYCELMYFEVWQAQNLHQVNINTGLCAIILNTAYKRRGLGLIVSNILFKRTNACL